MKISRQLEEKVGQVVGDGEMSHERLRTLLWPGFHSPHVGRHRGAVIAARVRLIAWVFAILTLAWIVVDLMLLPPAVAWPVVALRLVSAAAFVVLAWPRGAEGDQRPILRLWILMLNPLLFYAIAYLLLHGVEVHGWSAVLVAIYGLLPFIVVAGLSVFPLTVVESLGLGLMALVVMVGEPLLVGDFHRDAIFSAAWILSLLVGVCVLSTAIQLHYMMSLLHRVSFDPLTGAFSRNTGRELVDLYFQLSLEQERPFALLFADLDKFKSINDDHGHEAGDTALRQAVKGLQHSLRRGDMVVRWGGEEFVVILPGTDEAGVGLVLERIMGDWLGARPDGSPLTASIGVAERIADSVEDWPLMVVIADRRMYEAKQNGRARAVSCNETLLVAKRVG